VVHRPEAVAYGLADEVVGGAACGVTGGPAGAPELLDSGARTTTRTASPCAPLSTFEM
jgi:hypothetical protein